MQEAPRGNRGRARPLLVGLVLAPVLLAGCGSGATSASAASTKIALERTCTDIADVLSDGPDPTADPVGYALAQVRPLRAVPAHDSALRSAIEDLAAAYERVYVTNAAAGTEAAVTAAGRKLDKICPGAF